jgi:L-asparaginase II
MLAACATNGWSLHDYLDGTHPVQIHIRTAVEELAGERVAAVTVDGCGAPALALSLVGLARAMAALTRSEVADAMRAHPDLVGGEGRDVTRLMLAVPGLAAKDGAEGDYVATLPDGRTVALKIDDGAGRARVPVMTAALMRLGVPETALEDLRTVPVVGHGRTVGHVAVTDDLCSSTA